MALLIDQDRAELCALLSREVSELREALGVSKADLRAAVNAADAWADTNAASFNSALPLPARTAMTTQQKARLLMYVIRQRFARS
jgi:hypothetical protein